jgi:hypothetical protein
VRHDSINDSRGNHQIAARDRATRPIGEPPHCSGNFALISASYAPMGRAVADRACASAGRESLYPTASRMMREFPIA